MDVSVLMHPGEASGWDDYVERHPTATNYHQLGWKSVIERGFGHKTHYLLARDGETLVGLLPLVIMKSRLFGKFAVSMPFFNYGGMLADDEAIEEALLAAAKRTAIEEQSSHIELRHQSTHGFGLQVRQHKVTMILDLAESVELQWKGLDAKVRNQVRKAEKSELSVETGGTDLLSDFYGVFCRNMRDLGTPVYGLSFFKEILRSFPSSTSIFVVRLDGRPVAAGIASGFKETIEVPWASSLREYRNLCPNMLLYWSMISSSIDRGFRKFDFGRSTPGEGTHKFKEQWGAKSFPLAWEYWTGNAKDLPDLSPKNPKYERAIELWKRLPVAVANRLGPSIVRNIP